MCCDTGGTGDTGHTGGTGNTVGPDPWAPTLVSPPHCSHGCPTFTARWHNWGSRVGLHRAPRAPHDPSTPKGFPTTLPLPPVAPHSTSKCSQHPQTLPHSLPTVLPVPPRAPCFPPSPSPLLPVDPGASHSLSLCPSTPTASATPLPVLPVHPRLFIAPPSAQENTGLVSLLLAPKCSFLVQVAQMVFLCSALS